MKRLLALVLIQFSLIGIWAENVTEEQALQRAQQFLTNQRATSGGARRAPGILPQLTLASQVSGLYVFNVNDNGGFVIVSNDDRTVPILGFSDSGSFNPNNIPTNMRAWLQGYANEIAWLAQQGGPSTATPIKERQLIGSHSTTAVTPLLTTTWDQGWPYNYLCPYANEYGFVTGCVATAMAQAMYYTERQAGNNTTATTAEIPAYTTQTYSIPMESGIAAGSVLNWSNMIDDYSGNYPDDYSADNIIAVATLMKYCGWSVQMDYGPESGAQTSMVGDALKTYFGYANTTQFVSRSFYSYANWTDLIYNELQQGRPVIYNGQATDGGHCFVCDGYKYEDNTDLFHINWGWGGTSNGYFVLSVLNPQEQGIGGSASSSAYNAGQGAIVGIQKIGGSGTVLDVPANTVSLGLVSYSVSPATIALGESVDVVARVRNYSSDDYDGDLFLLVNDNMGTGKMFEIAAGATQDCHITFTPTEAGDYTLGLIRPDGSGRYVGWNGVSTLTVVDQTPTDLAAADITSETAMIGWTNVGEATQWNLRSRQISITTENINDYSSLSNWGVYDQNGDGSSWSLHTSAGIDGSMCFISPSYSDGTDHNPTDWLLAPSFTLGGYVSFYAWGKDEHFVILFSTNGTNFSHITNDITATDVATQYTLNFSAASGTGWIAILHCNSSGHTSDSYLFVDDFTFTSPASDWTTTSDVMTNPYRLSGMSKKTDYEVQAQPVINGGGYWSSSLCFSTTDNAIALANSSSNVELISTWEGVTADITLKDRILYKDGSWNTLCLPFDVTIADSPLVGADVRALSSASYEGGTLTLNFTASGDITTLSAGTPYIIKWTSGSNLTESNLVFTGAVVSKAKNDFTSLDEKVQFKGTYSSTSFDSEDKSILFMGTASTLHYPQSGASIGAQRAYFQLSDGSSPVKQFVLNFEGDDPDGIGNVQSSPAGSQLDAWFSLDGKRLDARPTHKGVYVNNGHKVIIK